MQHPQSSNAKCKAARNINSTRYAHVIKRQPAFATLAGYNIAALATIVHAQKSCRPKKSFPRPRIAPATGDPIRSPKPQAENTIPIRVPTISSRGESVTIVVGGSDTKDPVKNPYRMQNTIKPPLFSTAIQQYARTADINAQGTIMLSGPVLSAT